MGKEIRSGIVNQIDRGKGHFTENVDVINYEELLEKLSETNCTLRALVSGKSNKFCYF